MPTVSVSAFGAKPQFFDASGAPDVSYKLFMYVAGSTSTKQNSYTNSTGAVANTNPIILNSLGQTPNELWWDSSLIYKAVLAPSTDTDPPTNPIWTIDNLQGINNNNGSIVLSEWILYTSSAIAFINSTTFSIVGNQTLTFHQGRRLQFITTGGTVYGTILTSVFSSVTTVTMVMDGIQVLDSGLNKVYYSILTAINTAVPPNAALQSFRNKIINGGFQINQRAVSGTVTLAAGIYGHDRWKAGAAGCTYTFATVNNVTTITISAGSLLQIIEGNNLQSGQSILSWGGTAQGQINSGGFSTTGITANITGGTNLTVEFNTGTLSFVQFEPGFTSTLFENRHFGIELALCQRYLPAFNIGIASTPFSSGYVNSSTLAIALVPLPVQARVAPTGLIASAGNLLSVETTSNPFTSGSITLQNSTTLAARIYIAISGAIGNTPAEIVSANPGLIYLTGCEL